MLFCGWRLARLKHHRLVTAAMGKLDLQVTAGRLESEAIAVPMVWAARAEWEVPAALLLPEEARAFLAPLGLAELAGLPGAQGRPARREPAPFLAHLEAPGFPVHPELLELLGPLALAVPQDRPVAAVRVGPAALADRAILSRLQ